MPAQGYDACLEMRASASFRESVRFAGYSMLSATACSAAAVACSGMAWHCTRPFGCIIPLRRRRGGMC